jgi:DNA-binding response OmpR family regulator
MALLLIEDNERLAGLLKQGLERTGFRVDVIDTATDAIEALAAIKFEVVILDLGLPDEDGLSVLKTMRQRGDMTPVIVMTARGSLRERVEGLDSGADDYLVKPVALEELVARINALLRRPGNLLGTALRLGNLTLDTAGRQVFIDERAEIFGSRELAILEHLLRRSGRVIPKKFLENSLYGLGEEISSNAVEVYVHRLRKRLADVGANVLVHTVRGVGYMISEAK